MSRMGPITAEERAETLAGSPLAGRYDTPVDRESASELLAARASDSARDAELAEELLRGAESERGSGTGRRYRPTSETGAAPRAGPSVGEELARTVVKQLNSRHGQKLVRGILGSLFKGR
jgi:hypothetical protein